MSDHPLTVDQLASVITSCAGAYVEAQTLHDQPTATFADLGVDSLGVLGIVTELENRYGIRLGVNTEVYQTPHDLRVLVNTALASEVGNARNH
jgi:minimal PKS acyl carrier protein